MDEPIVLSVCIPTYNRKRLLEQSLNKLLSYQKDDLEIVVVDNCSTDETWEMLQGISDSRVSLFRNSENLGATYNYRRAILSGQGQFCMHLNDRDTIETDALSAFISFLRNCDADVIITGDQIEAGKYLGSGIRGNAYACTRSAHAGWKTYAQHLVVPARLLWEEYDCSVESLDMISEYWEHLLISSDKWITYGKEPLIQLCKDVHTVKPNRVTFGMQNYFTPESRVEQTLLVLRNSYITEDEREQFSKGVLESKTERLLPTINYEINEYRRGHARYSDFDPSEYEIFLKDMSIFYSGVCRGLKSDKLLTANLHFFFLMTCVRLYISFIISLYRFRWGEKFRRIIKRVLPQPIINWIKKTLRG